MYLSALLRHRRGDESGFPWTVPAVASLESLEFHVPVSFFVGDNGSGKSTVLEGIAVGMRAVAAGSSELEDDDSLRGAREFVNGFRFVRRRHPRNKLFFRAEDVFGFTRRIMRTMRDLSEIEEEFKRTLPDGSYGQKLAVGAARGQRTALESRYGGDPDARSHGEVFLALLASRLTPGGLYLLDEPEAPLSPWGVIRLMALIKDRVSNGCQFIVATHSPILLAYPDAAIHLFAGDRIAPVRYEDVEHVKVTKAFLNDRERFLRHL